jgi:hypothetical protein
VTVAADSATGLKNSLAAREDVSWKAAGTEYSMIHNGLPDSNKTLAEDRVNACSMH